MKIKTSKLTDAALDWIVLQLEKGKNKDASEVIWQKGNCSFSPTTNWNQGGSIIEREWLDITPWPNESEEEMRWSCDQHDVATLCRQYGPSPLIAAMRCYVASKLGDEVEIPDELI